MEVKRSWRFQAAAYPGYRHARTLGVVKGRNGESGGWKGQDRAARSYEFVRKGEGVVMGVGKAKREESSEDEGDENPAEDENEDENSDDEDTDDHETENDDGD